MNFDTIERYKTVQLKRLRIDRNLLRSCLLSLTTLFNKSYGEFSIWPSYPSIPQLPIPYSLGLRGRRDIGAIARACYFERPFLEFSSLIRFASLASAWELYFLRLAVHCPTLDLLFI